MSGLGEKEQENSSTGTESLRFKCLGARIGLRRSFLRLRQPTIALPTSEKVDTAGRSVPAFFSPDLLSLKAQRACNFLYDTVMSKLYRRKTNSKEPATEKRPRLYT